MAPEAWLSENLAKVFALPDEPREWLLALWNLAQVFDDMADGANPDRDDVDRAILDALVNMPENAFFLHHRETLLPLVAVAILKWKASDTAERNGAVSPMSFVWRAGFYDIVLAVIQLVHGQQVAMDVCHKVMELYGEDFDAYRAEFTDA